MCQEALGAELAMLPCGHQLCVRCQMALIDRLPGNLPRVRPSSKGHQLHRVDLEIPLHTCAAALQSSAATCPAIRWGRKAGELSFPVTSVTCPDLKLNART